MGEAAETGFMVAGPISGPVGGMGSDLWAQHRAGQAEREQLRQEIRQLELDSELTSLTRHRTLQTVLGSQQAAFAGTGLDVGAGTPATIRKVDTARVEQEDRAARLTANAQRRKLELAIRFSRQRQIAAGVRTFMNTVEKSANLAMQGQQAGFAGSTSGRGGGVARTTAFAKGASPHG